MAKTYQTTQRYQITEEMQLANSKANARRLLEECGLSRWRVQALRLRLEKNLAPPKERA